MKSGMKDRTLTQARGLHPRCCVHRVSKETVPGHGETHHSRYHRACAQKAQINTRKAHSNFDFIILSSYMYNIYSN